MTSPAPSARGRTVWAALGVVYLVWGSTYLAIRVMVEDVPPLLGAATRFVVAGVVMLAVLAARGHKVRCDRRALAGAALIGVLLPAGGNGLVTVAERDVPSGLAALLVASVPLWVVILRATAGRERVTRSTLAGIAVGFAGLALLLLPGSRPAEATAIGVVLVLIAALSWATGSFLSPRLAMPADALVSTAWQLVFGGAALAGAAIVAGEPQDTHLGAIAFESWAALAYLISFGSWLAYTAYAWLLQNAPIGKVATYAYVNPVVAVVLGWSILGESLGIGTALGALLVVGAVWAIVRGERRGSDAPALIPTAVARTTSTTRPASASG